MFFIVTLPNPHILKSYQNIINIKTKVVTEYDIKGNFYCHKR